MNQTLLHQFYKTSKEIPEKPFLRFKIKNSYHTLPWWLSKNKTKHFALGLIHRGFKPNDTFLICAPNCPEWIYTEMALFTLGMISVSCVERLEEENLLQLIEQSKTSGILIGWPSLLDRFRKIHERVPALKSIIATDEEIKSKYPELKLTTFREVFNEGVRNEDKLRPIYWEIRDSRKETDLVSEYYQIEKGSLKLAEKISYQSIQNFVSELFSRKIRFFNKQVLSLMPLSNLYNRLIALYLPIFHQGMTAFLSEEENILEAFAYSKPRFLLMSELKQNFVFHEILRILDQQNPLIKRIQGWRETSSQTFFGSIKKILGEKSLNRKIRKIFGGRIKKIIFEKENVSDEFKNLLKQANIKILFLTRLLTKNS